MRNLAGSTEMRRLIASSKVNGCNETGFAFGMTSPSMATPTECSSESGLTENDVRAASSASCDHVTEYRGILSVVMPIGKFIQVERQILLAHVVIRTHDATLQERPERINIGSVDLAAHVLALAVFNGFVLVVLIQQPIAGMLIGRNERDFLVYGLANEAIKRRRIGTLYHLANYVALASNRADHGNLAGRAPTFDALGEVLVAL